MKILSKEDLVKNLLDYFNKKNIEFIKIQNYYDGFKLQWNYYTNYYIRLIIEEKSENKFIIRYWTSVDVKIGQRSVHKLKTTILNSFAPVYKKLLLIKSEMDKKIAAIKIYTELKDKYSKELESHYKKIHKYVNIFIYNEQNNRINLSISATDNELLTTYSVIYNGDNNKYYLRNKSQNNINMILT